MGSESKPESHWSFHREEYLALRAEIDRHETQRSRLQYATVFGSILITWGIIRVDTGSFAEPILVLLSLAPLVLLFSGWLISRGHLDRSGEAGAYLRELERLYGYRGRGWEAFAKGLRQGRPSVGFHTAPIETPPAPAKPRRGLPATAATNVLFLGIGLLEVGVLFLNLTHPHPTVRAAASAAADAPGSIELAQ